MATAAPDWTHRAACRAPDVDPRLFYADADDTDASAREQIAAARAICATCPVREECLAEAQRLRDRHGVWGGLVAEERKALRTGRAIVTAEGLVWVKPRRRQCAVCVGTLRSDDGPPWCSERCAAVYGTAGRGRPAKARRAS